MTKKQFEERLNKMENEFCAAITAITELKKYDSSAETHIILHNTVETVRSLWHNARGKAYDGRCRHCFNKIKSANTRAAVCDCCAVEYAATRANLQHEKE